MSFDSYSRAAEENSRELEAFNGPTFTSLRQPHGPKQPIPTLENVLEPAARPGREKPRSQAVKHTSQVR